MFDFSVFIAILVLIAPKEKKKKASLGPIGTVLVSQQKVSFVPQLAYMIICDW